MKNLFMVSARFHKILFILQTVLMFTFKSVLIHSALDHIKMWSDAIILD